jgi:hypothetical protein
VIALDDGDGPGWAKQPTKRNQGPDRIGKVFKDETDKDVIEGFRRERRIHERSCSTLSNLCLEGLCCYERRIAELERLARAATPALGQGL